MLKYLTKQYTIVIKLIVLCLKEVKSWHYAIMYAEIPVCVILVLTMMQGFRVQKSPASSNLNNSQALRHWVIITNATNAPYEMHVPYIWKNTV